MPANHKIMSCAALSEVAPCGKCYQSEPMTTFSISTDSGAVTRANRRPGNPGGDVPQAHQENRK